MTSKEDSSKDDEAKAQTEHVEKEILTEVVSNYLRMTLKGSFVSRN